MRLRSLTPAAALAACVVACSSSPSGAPGPAGVAGGGSGSSSGGSVVATQTWKDGTTLSSSVVIAAGQTVTIAPGASISVGQGVTLTVLGTLTASSASPTHARLAGASWAGVVVGSGGTLTLDGVDLAGASAAITVEGGAHTAEYDDGTLSGSAAPFTVAANGALGTQGATVTGTLGTSTIAGSFTASHLSYDSVAHEGIETTSTAAELSIEDSTLFNSGAPGCTGCDMLIAGGGAARFHVAYTTITNVHCAFHFDTLSEFDLSYLDLHGNSFGFMLYGSGGAGPFTVSYSNIYSNSSYAYDAAGMNSPITFDHDYVSGKTSAGPAVSTTNPESSPVAGVGPRT